MRKLFIFNGETYQMYEIFADDTEKITITDPYIVLYDDYPFRTLEIVIHIDSPEHNRITVYSNCGETGSWVSYTRENSFSIIDNSFAQYIMDNHQFMMSYLLYMVPHDETNNTNFTDILYDIITSVRESYPDIPTGL